MPHDDDWTETLSDSLVPAQQPVLNQEWETENHHCTDCGLSPPLLLHLAWSLPKHYKYGKSVHTGGMCMSCADSHDDRIFYCPVCMNPYEASLHWWQLAQANVMAAVPCQKHAHPDSGKLPAYQSQSVYAFCAVCNDPTSNRYMNLRGEQFCTGHAWELIKCKSKFCTALIHPQSPTVHCVPHTNSAYCKECAVAKTTPGGAPEDYNPYTWNYKATCPCVVCNYLRGRGSEHWPSDSDMIPADKLCHGCPGQLQSSVAFKWDGWTWCHLCEVKYFTECKVCENQVHIDEITEIGANVMCHNCCTESPDTWYCEGVCETWFMLDTECACGGVLPYTYSPETFIPHLATNEIFDVDKHPLIGLELEVEAHKGNSSRPNGCRIVTDLMGDFVYVMHDGSLKGKKNDGLGGHFGFEVVTHPFSMAHFHENWNTWEELLRVLKNKGYRSWEGGRCGIHVHISRAPMTQAHQMKFIRFIYGSVNMVMCIGQRSYRNKALAKFSPFEAEVRAEFRQKITHHVNPGINGHYTALNTMCPHTLEGRWFRGTLNPIGLRKNVEFMHAVWYFTKHYGHSSANEVNFMTWLREPGQRQDYAVVLEYLERHYITRR